MSEPIYNPHTSTTLTSLGVDVIARRLTKLKDNPTRGQPAIVNIANVLKIKSYRTRGIDLVMHLKRANQPESNDVVSVSISTSNTPVSEHGGHAVIFDTIVNDVKRVRIAGDFFKTDARMWYYLHVPTASLYQFPTNAIREWVKKEISFSHDWFEPRVCNLFEVQSKDPRWVVTGSFNDADIEYRSWGVALPLADVLTGVQKQTGKTVTAVDVLEDLVCVAHEKGVLGAVWNSLAPYAQRRALVHAEKHGLTFDTVDPTGVSANQDSLGL